MCTRTRAEGDGQVRGDDGQAVGVHVPLSRVRRVADVATQEPHVLPIRESELNRVLARYRRSTWVARRSSFAKASFYRELSTLFLVFTEHSLFTHVHH